VANRYWVGGTATWDGTIGLKWALTSGGIGGQLAPTTADTVFFDANSGAGTVTLGTTGACSTINFSGFTGTFAWGTNTITVAGSGVTVYTQTTSSTFTGTPVLNFTYSGSTGTRTINCGSVTEANSATLNISAGGDTVTFQAASGIKNLNFTGFTGALSSSTTRTIYGNLIFGSGMTTGGNVQITTFGATSGTQTLTCNGVTVTFPFLQNGIGGTVQLGSALTTSNTYTLTNGVFDANNYNVTVASFSSNNSNTRTITMGSGAWTLTAATGTVTVWNLATTTGLTFNKNTANIQITSATSGTKTFAGGGLTYNTLTITETAGSLIIPITGANTFNTLASSQTNAWTLTLPASATTTVGSWSIAGASGTIVTLNSSSAGTQATLTLNGGGIVSSDYLSIQDSAATPATTWYAGTNSTNVSNNTGWIFTAPPTVVNNGNFFLLFG